MILEDADPATIDVILKKKLNQERQTCPYSIGLYPNIRISGRWPTIRFSISLFGQVRFCFLIEFIEISNINVRACAYSGGANT